ncbi:lytic murein transglycosylase [Salinibacterium sp. ZJ70]|uniref:lytic murein transglycosylase n=1 Tax=Salinibacterium sp. ZJ70 TaxID=2708084 RepID=UPI001422826C|nr:lytic murein transglycosylase [Salinibacterium sp. ZJ70]
MSPVRRTVLVVVSVLASLGVLAAAIIWFLAPRSTPTPTEPTPDPLPTWAPPAGQAPRAMQPYDGVSVVGLADPAWLDTVSEATGIPRRALAAYAGATIIKEDHRPDCRLDWATLAAIGAVESDHGRHGGSSIGDDGRVTPPIYGVALDGNGVALIPDSDGGEIDGDPELDRAVGPLQMIPQTWRNWTVDGNADGVADPQNIDDAALAAANYLCRASSDFDTEDGWRAGVRAYNVPEVYLGTVAKYARAYAAEAAEALHGASPTPTPTPTP